MQAWLLGSLLAGIAENRSSFTPPRSFYSLLFADFAVVDIHCCLDIAHLVDLFDVGIPLVKGTVALDEFYLLLFRPES